MAGRYVDPPIEAVTATREACAHLPGITEEQAWAGVRWQIRGRTFAHVLHVLDDVGPGRTVITFRSSGEELLSLRNAGPPFRGLGWGSAISVEITEDTDWDEIAELLTESYCLYAPRKLVAQIRP